MYMEKELYLLSILQYVIIYYTTLHIIIMYIS